jgi:hypothetical protein
MKIMPEFELSASMKRLPYHPIAPSVSSYERCCVQLSSTYPVKALNHEKRDAIWKPPTNPIR